MPLNSNQTLRLMIVDDSVEAAESFVSLLRNDGITVRPMRAESAEQAKQLIESQPLDMVIISTDSSDSRTEQVLHHVQASGKDLPALSLRESIDARSLEHLQMLGIRAVLLRNRPNQLLRQVRNEYADLDARRSRRRLDAQVREVERRCDALIESSRDPIAYIHEGMHIRANSAYLEMFGFQSEDDIEGMSLLDLVDADDAANFKQLLKTLSKGESAPPQYQAKARTLNGETFPATMEFTSAMYDGESCLQVVFRRQEVNPDLVRELEQLRNLDQATGLLNRSSFLPVLEQAVAGVVNQGQTHTLLLIEPDHYQRLLATVGLQAADALVKSLATAVQSVLPAEGVAARFSEHGLAVLLPEFDHIEGGATAERIREAVAGQVFELMDNSLTMTVSIGGVHIGERMASISQVLTCASKNVESAAGLGGNRVELYDAGEIDRAEAERIAAWGQHLREALSNDSFVMLFQPFISLQGNPGEHYECVLRLRNDEELVLPRTFLPLAEQHGLVEQIDHWIIRKTAQILSQRYTDGHPVTLLVKVSQNSLVNPAALIDVVREALSVNQLDGKYLVIQVTEANMFAHIKAAQELIQRLAEIGVRMCLEKFGAGVDSFQLLSHLEHSLPSFIKIDGSFSEDLGSNEQAQTRVNEIATRAQTLGIDCIAERVADANSMAVLFSSGVQYVQGQFLAMPGPAMDYQFD